MKRFGHGQRLLAAHGYLASVGAVSSKQRGRYVCSRIRDRASR
jgi:hypothetical protein